MKGKEIKTHWLIHQALVKYFSPPSGITVSQWAESYRTLNSHSSAMPGKWHNELTPYLIGIMDEFTNYDTEEIIFCKPSQIGGTEAMQNILGYIVDQDPGACLIIYPSDSLGASISRNRLKCVFQNTNNRLLTHLSSVDELQFANMYISISGANSPSQLSSKPIRYLFLDEVDKYPGASKKEADPISLARERTKTFVTEKKIYMTSTPTIRNGQIWQAKENADCEKHYFVPCPHCNDYIELKFSNLRWAGKKTKDDEELSYADRAETAHYICQNCGCIITDIDRHEMLQNGQWQIVRQSSRYPKKVAFWINTLYSPFTTFRDIALEFMNSKDSPERLQNFTNAWLAEPWEETRLKTSAEIVFDRQTDIPEFIVPSWARLLTAGVDIQENCIYFTIRAWGDFVTSQNIAHGQVFDWDSLTEIMNRPYFKEDGTSLLVKLALIDSGDNTDAVYEYCIYNSEWTLPCKGSAKTLESNFKISTINKINSKAYGSRLVLIDTGKYKNAIYGRLQKENNKKGTWLVHKDCDLEYANQITSEQRVKIRRNGHEQEVWITKGSHTANHYLDCEVYAFAAADMNNVRFLYAMTQEIVNENENASDNINTTEDWFNKDLLHL